MTLHVQFLTMISMCLSGLYLGGARDTFRRFSPYWNHKRSYVYIFEIVFWMFQTIAMFYILYLVNAGELRVYVFLSCLLGYSIYQVFFAELYRKVLESIICLISHIYRLCKRVIYVLVIRPLKWILFSVFKIMQFILILVLWIIRIVVTPIKWLLSLGYCLLPKGIQKNIRKLIGVYSIIKNTIILWFKNILFRKR